MVSQGAVAGSVFGGQVVAFAVMFTMFKFISQTCVDIVDGQKEDLKGCPAGGQVKFGRPMLNAFMMVGSMALIFLYYFPFRYNKPGSIPVTKKALVYILLPSFLDCCCSLLLLVGSKPIPMSLALVLKGTRIAFSCILAIFMLKKKIWAYNWTGVGIALLGASLAGLSAILNSQSSSATSTHSTGEVVMGICLVVAGEFFRSLMVTIQEMFMKKKLCEPAFLMSLGGVYGGIFIGIALILAWKVLPGSDVGDSYENLEITFKQASESGAVTTMLCLIPIFSAVGFLGSAMVSYLLSAIYNAMASVLMTALVWAFELAGHAIVSTIGTTWATYSPMQLAGFILVIFGILVYDGSFVRFPSVFNYPPKVEKNVEEVKQKLEEESHENVVANSSTIADGEVSSPLEQK